MPQVKSKYSQAQVKEIYNTSKATLITYLAGEGQSESIFNNLYGLHNPSGRLPETWIETFPLSGRHSPEGLPVLYPELSTAL